MTLESKFSTDTLGYMLKSIGNGLVGAPLLLHAMPTIARQIDEEVRDESIAGETMTLDEFLHKTTYNPDVVWKELSSLYGMMIGTVATGFAYSMVAAHDWRWMLVPLITNAASISYEIYKHPENWKITGD